MTTTGPYPCRSPRVAARVIDGEAVIVSPDDAMLHNLNEVATVIWELADGRTALAEIAAQVVARYEVDADEALADVRLLCEELNRKGILDWCKEPVG